MERTRRENNGFSLVELMIFSAVSVLVIGVIIAALVMTEKMQKAGTKQASLQRNSQILQEKIVRRIRAARSLVIKDSGDTAEFTVDPNFTPYDYGDDITSSFYLTVTAATTPEGETIYNLFYDPDITQATDEQLLSSSLVKDATRPLFAKDKTVLAVNFSLKDDFAGDGFQTVDISTSFYVRNL